jgi:hypothetical protein
VGHQSRLRQERKDKKEIIHRKVLFGGVETAQEVHARLGWRGRCNACGGPPVVQIRCFMLLADAQRLSPIYVQSIMATSPDGRVPTQATKYGPMIRFSSALACVHHQKEAEKVAASAPSYVFVEIDRGPGAERPVVSVPVQVSHISESVSGGRSE